MTCFRYKSSNIISLMQPLGIVADMYVFFKLVIVSLHSFYFERWDIKHTYKQKSGQHYREKLPFALIFSSKREIEWHSCWKDIVLKTKWWLFLHKRTIYKTATRILELVYKYTWTSVDKFSLFLLSYKKSWSCTLTLYLGIIG